MEDKTSLWGCVGCRVLVSLVLSSRHCVVTWLLWLKNVAVYARGIAVLVEWWRRVWWRAVKAEPMMAVAVDSSQSPQYPDSLTRPHRSCGLTDIENGLRQQAMMLQSLFWKNIIEYALSILSLVFVWFSACIRIVLKIESATEYIVACLEVNQTRGQSNLAKAALNTLHTLHAQDSIAVAVFEISRQSQNLIAGHVILPCIVLDRIRSHVYAHKISRSSCSHARNGSGVWKFKSKSRDPAQTPYDLLLHSFH